jgi:methylated-DNA-[protein]-cysteine S-methyltransferase
MNHPSAATTRYTVAPSPIGELLVLVDDDKRVTGLYVDTERGAPSIESHWDRDESACGTAVDQLDAYFAGELTAFDLDLNPVGTPFQLEVWSTLAAIPFAETLSYREVAEEVGRPLASRAVGQANGCNPISIIVPCHRVIAADGSLGGYGWGLERKQWLLDHEARTAATNT